MNKLPDDLYSVPSSEYFSALQTGAPIYSLSGRELDITTAIRADDTGIIYLRPKHPKNKGKNHE